MKKIFIPRLFIIFIASAILLSCSKENLSAPNSGETTGGTKTIPVYNYGGISGRLTPVPTYAALKVYNDEENFATNGSPDMNGNFTIPNLMPATYRMVVIYIPAGAPPNSEYSYYERRGIVVEAGVVTQLGDIILTPQ
ncbi:MAG TPA: hypothetical protein VK483_13355 [Chitinophagaceae bacterium]|nr:hypothetical protein [Chitinophagaceae bacterium]